MSGNFLAAFLSMVVLPDGVAPDVVHTYGSRFPDHLARNHSLGPHAKLLLSQPLSADAVAALINAGDCGVLESVLDSKQSSMPVTWAVLDRWDLSPTDQLRLASRALPKVTANRMLDYRFDPQVQRQVFARASTDCQLAWLTDSDISDDELFEKMRAMNPKFSILRAVVDTLTLREGLRIRALHSTATTLKVAACWTELPTSEHDYAAEFATECELFASPADPVIGLLNQIGLDQKLRQELADWVVAQSYQRYHKRRHFRYHRPNYSVIGHGLSLASVSDSANISTIINDASYMTRARNRNAVVMSAQNRTIASMVIYELSRNPHLDFDQLTRLARVVFQHSDVRYGAGTPVLSVALRNIAAKMRLANQSAFLGKSTLDYMGEMSLNSPSSRVLNSLLRSDPAYTTTVLNPETFTKWHRYTTSTDPLDQLLEQPLAGFAERTSNAVGQLQALSPEFSNQLGDGSSPLSRRTWMVFLGLAQDDPEVPLQAVLNTAKRLAQIEA